MNRQIRSQKITFENDVPGQPPPSPCVTEALAQMIESAVRASGVTININSTTGGIHSPTSFHKFGRAVDINRLNNKRIDDPDNLTDVLSFQQIVARHPMVAECFGPYVNIRKYGKDKKQKPAMKNKHLDHLHISSQA